MRRSLLAVLLSALLVPLTALPAQAVTPLVSVNDVTVVEPTGGNTTWVRFTVTLSEPSDAPVEVAWSFDSRGGGNLVLWNPTGRTQIPAGSTSGAFYVEVHGDHRYTATDPVYPVTLSAPVGAEIADVGGTLTVENVEPNGEGTACRAAADWNEVLGMTTTGVANKGFTPCKNDGDATATWQAWTHGSPGFWYSSPWQVAYAKAAREQVDVGGPYSWVSAGHVEARMDLTCSAEHVLLIGGWSEVENYSIIVNSPDPKYSWPIVDEYDHVYDHRSYALPDGTTVELNKASREPYTDATGATGEVITRQALVITSPAGVKQSFGEAKVAYVGDPCSA